MLHYIRQVIGNDDKFRKILRGLNKTFYHQIVTSAQVEHYISKQAKKDFSKLFDQYLRTTQVPVLEYKISNNSISYRWDSCVAGFNMPVKVSLGKADGSEPWLSPTTEWKEIKAADWYDKKTFITNKNFYVKTAMR